MKLSDLFLSEFDHEMSTARTTLERIPEDKLSWKPHEKSMPLNRLARHIAELAGWDPATTLAVSFCLTPGASTLHPEP